MRHAMDPFAALSGRFVINAVHSQAATPPPGKHLNRISKRMRARRHRPLSLPFFLGCPEILYPASTPRTSGACSAVSLAEKTLKIKED
ncbi:MAG TPA: hypothetical protein DHV85_11285 [Candidatus Accumulibacter sp.]|nr:hypothetical protein [Accumulibacter sp.]